MARKVIDIIYNLVRKRMTLKGDGTGITTGKITSLPNSAQVERGMQTIFNRLKQGGYNVMSAEKAIKNEDDLARILEEINQSEIAEIKRRKDASEGIETVIDKMNRGIPLNPGDQAKIEGAGMKTTLDAFRGFEPKVIPGGKMSGIEAMKEANLLIARKGKYKNISESDAKTKLNELQEIINKANAEPDLGTKLKNFDGDPDAMAGGGLAGALAKLKKKFGKDIIQKGKAPKKSEKKKIQDMFRDFNRKNKAGGGLAYMLGEPRENFADGGMSRRTFLKIMAALAAFPVVGKLAKTAKVAKGAAPMVTPTAEMPAHFPKLVEKILREGQVVDSQFVKKTGDIKTYKHPDRPDIELTVEGEGDRITLDFETDQGMRGGYEFKKGKPDEMVPNPPNEFEAGEVKYKMSPDGDYSKDFELGIDTGTENLDEFAGVGKQKTSKSKVNLPESLDDDFADGGLAGLLGE